MVQYCRSGVRADDPNRIVYLENLASAHSNQFNALGKPEDIDIAISLSKQVITSGVLNSVQLPQCYFNLSSSYIRKLRRFGKDEDLESARLWIQKAVDSAPLGHPDIPGFQRGLALIYVERFDRFGHRGDLDSALAWNLQAVASATEGSGRHHLPTCQHNLALSYKDQYQRYGDVADIESALHYFQAALSNVPPGDPFVIEIQHSMASLYRTKYLGSREVADLEAAMSLGKAVVAATPNNHNEIGARLALLAGLHSDRYHKLGDREDRSAALKLYISSVELTPAGHPDLPVFQSRLAIEYSNRYAMLREEEYLEAALKYMSASVEATPPDHRLRGHRESLLAQFHAQKSNSFRAPEDRERGLLYFRNAINAPNIVPSEQWDIACKWAAFADINRLPEALEAYAIALRALPELLWLGSNITTRHESLLRYNVTSTTMQAVAASIHLGNLELAVEFLEQSLAITFQQLLDLREEFSALEAAHPELSARLTNVSVELQKIAIINGGDDGDSPAAVERTKTDRQRRLATERDSILKEVRTLESLGISCYPLPIPAFGTKNCDVLILLRPDEPIQHIPLKWSLVKEAEEKLGKLRVALGLCGIQSRGTHSEIDGNTDIGVDGEEIQETRYGRPMAHQKPDPKQAFGEVLAWLWAMVVSRVFESLRTNGFNDGRLWWCPTGPFTYLPLHAAGPPNNFIQSYTSTLAALLDARKSHVAEKEQPSVTVVALSQRAGGKASLPNVKEELLKIEATVGQSNAVILANDRATLVNVEAALPQSTWLHLACHGQQNTKDPLKSGLLLYDAKLDLGKLMTTPLPHAEFVFMSACETAMGDPKMTNESLHLAGGMLFAGFKAAIGTMWSINDQDGPPVAEAVYNHTWGQGKVPSVTDTAEALHLAVNKLRNQNVPPHRWVPFIHIGI
ncbi:CHAT domain-containing protein [Infundibulicybe gibba]|nr:CHAT domain-containing protein [Infundibulicybe gibba]